MVRFITIVIALGLILGSFALTTIEELHTSVALIVFFLGIALMARSYNRFLFPPKD